MGFGLIIFLLFAGVIVAIALGLGRVLLSNTSSLSGIFSGSNKRTSREILEERFVKGEITREEFELMKKEIEK